MRKLTLTLMFLCLAIALRAQTTISDVYVSSSTPTTATIVWTTSTPATSQIKYGFTSSSLPYSNNEDTTLVTSHSMTLTYLNASQPYYFAVVSVDAGGASATSSTYEFALCGTADVPVVGSVNMFYGGGSVTITWNPPAGASGTPTICGANLQTTMHATMDAFGSFNATVGDALKVTPGPGTWTVSVDDPGNLAPISVTEPLSYQTRDVSEVLRTQAAAAGLHGCISSTISGAAWPPGCEASAGGPTIEHNGSSTNILRTLLNFWDTPTSLAGGTGTLDSGYQAVTFKTDTLGGWAAETLQPQLVPYLSNPVSSSYAVLYPQTGVITSCSTASEGFTCTITTKQPFTATGLRTRSCPLCQANGTWTWTGAVLPSYIPATSVTEIDACFYVYATASPAGSNGGRVFNSQGTVFLNTTKAIPYSNVCTVVATGSAAQTFDYSTASWSFSDVSSTGYTYTTTDYVQPYFAVYTPNATPVNPLLTIQSPLTLYGNTIGLPSYWRVLFDTGSANAYVATSGSFPTSGSTTSADPPGDQLTLQVLNSNTGASTFSLNGQTPVAIVKASGGSLVALASGDISSSVGAVLENLGTEWLLLNPLMGSGSTGLSGMTAGQVPIAATATTVTSSKPLAGAGAGITTGPTSATLDDCVKFAADGSIVDAGAACGGSGALPSGVNGQTAVNDGSSATSYSAQSPTIGVANGGSVITTAYTLLCDSATVATGIQDRGKIAIVGSGGSVTIPDLSGTGCSGFFGGILNSTSSAVTISRQTTDTFTVYGPTQGAPSTGQTSYSLPAGSYLSFSPDAAASTYDLRVVTPPATSGVTVENNGTSLGTATTINFAPSTSVSLAGGTATVSASSGSGSNMVVPRDVNWAIANPNLYSSTFAVVGPLDDGNGVGSASFAPTNVDANGVAYATYSTGTVADTQQGYVTAVKSFIAGKAPSMKVAVGLGASTGVDAWVAMCGYCNVSAAGTLDPSLSGTVLAGFRYFSGTDTDWQCYEGDGTHAGQLVSTGVAPDTTDLQTFDLIVTNGGVYDYYINGTQVCSFTPTNPISSTQGLGVESVWQNTTTTSVTVKVGRLYGGSN